MHSFLTLFWNQEIVQYYERHVTRQEIEEVFKDITPILYNSLGKELMNLFQVKWKRALLQELLKREKGVFTEDKL